jgi:hypothetical protein
VSILFLYILQISTPENVVRETSMHLLKLLNYYLQVYMIQLNTRATFSLDVATNFRTDKQKGRRTTSVLMSNVVTTKFTQKYNIVELTQNRHSQPIGPAFIQRNVLSCVYTLRLSSVYALTVNTQPASRWMPLCSQCRLHVFHMRQALWC